MDTHDEHLYDGRGLAHEMKKKKFNNNLLFLDNIRYINNYFGWDIIYKPFRLAHTYIMKLA